MARKSGGRAKVTAANTVVDIAGSSATASLHLTHEDFPGWEFVLRLDQRGYLEAFTVQPPTQSGAEAGRGMTKWMERHQVGEMPPGGVTARMLRRVPVGELLAAAQAHMGDRAEFANQTYGGESSYVHALTQLASDQPRPGRRSRPPGYYAAWASRYVEACSSSRTPVEDLAAEEHLAPATVRNLIYEARRRGLLTPSPPGRAGGELTDKAQDLLRDTDTED